MDTVIQGYRDTQEYRNTGIQGYKDTEIRGYRDTDIHSDTGIQGYKDTRIQDTGI